MNLLLEKAPESVVIAGKQVPICADFRQSIRFEALIQDASVSDEEKLIRGLQLYYQTIPQPIEEAVEKMLWFYQCGQEETEEQGNARKKPPIYSYEHDGGYIYAAFQDQYQINLQSIEFLHWWEFKSLFMSLKEDNEIVKIMGYRAIELPSSLSKQQREFYQKMKRQYALPLPKADRQRLNALEKALMGDGNVQGLI